MLLKSSDTQQEHDCKMHNAMYCRLGSKDLNAYNDSETGRHLALPEAWADSETDVVLAAVADGNGSKESR